MNKKIILWFVFFYLLVFIPICQAQYLTSADIVPSFKKTMQNDNLTFPDSVIYQLINMATGIVCVHGFANPKIDSIVLIKGTDQYGLKYPALWVYRISKVGSTERAWARVDLSAFGKYFLQDVTFPSFWDFTNELETGAGSITGTGIDTSYVWVYPKPASADSGDTIEASYFAYQDTLSSNLTPDYRDVLLGVTLMLGYFRAGKSDYGNAQWNKTSPALGILRNEMLKKVFDVEIVPRTFGGQQ